MAFLGLSAAGAVLVPVNTRFKGAEAADILQRSRAKVLVTVTDFLGTDYVAMLRGPVPSSPISGPSSSPGGRRWTGPSRGTPSTLAPPPTRSPRSTGGRPPSPPTIPCDILFTSGTTGVPKGVVQNHGGTTQVAADWVAMTGLDADDRYLMVNPYFHMFGLKAGILAAVSAGAAMIPEPVFDVDRVLGRVADEGVTVLPGAPTLYQGMLDHPDRDRYDLSTLRVAVTGAADIPVELIRRVDAELPFSVVITGYGLTEGGTAAATSPGDDVETIATTVGRPRPGFELRIVDGDGREVPAGEPGEILLRGRSVMAHYLDDPVATAEARSPDGWLRTGDLGTVDASGRLRIVGRSKDMFIVGGFNAYPAEIENALLRHPDIAEAAVIGIPDARLGEVGMAFVVPRPGAVLTGVDIIGWCRDQMANYKVPREVVFVDDLPAQRHGEGGQGRPAPTHGTGPPRTARVTAPGPHGLTALYGLRVVELGVWVAAPSAAALLADWGAEVIKVESPTGDPDAQRVRVTRHRGRPPRIRPSPLDNRGKRSVVLDLRDPDGRRRLEELLATADVFVTNLRPDALDKLDLEAEATVARHPRLVYCSISGYGLRGEDRNRPTYDIGAFWARSGLSTQMADEHGNPLNARGGIGDHITGLAALSGILAAVLEQRHTGAGRVVEVSLLRTGAYVLGWDLGLQMLLGKVSPAESRHHNQSPLMNPYRAADGRWFFLTGLEADRHIGAVTRALGRPELLEDERFASASAIRRNRTEFIRLLDGIIAERPLAEWAERFDREGVWWAPAQTPAEVVEDPQLLANDGFVEVEGGAVRSVNGPVTFSGVAPRGAVGVPELGEDSDDVLAELDDRSELDERSELGRPAPG